MRKRYSRVSWGVVGVVCGVALTVVSTAFAVFGRFDVAYPMLVAVVFWLLWNAGVEERRARHRRARWAEGSSGPCTETDDR